MKKLFATLKDIFTSKDDPKKKKQKLLIIIAAAVVAALIIAGGVFAAVMLTREPADAYTQQMEIGEKYIEEKEYEKAKAAFEEAIEKVGKGEEKNKKLENAYYYLASAYNGLGDSEGAKLALIEGIEKTSSKKLCDLYEEIFGEPYVSPDDTTAEDTTAEETTAEETTAEETTAAETTAEAETTAPQNDQSGWQNNNGGGGVNFGDGTMTGGGTIGSSQYVGVDNGPVPQAASTKDAYPEYVLTNSGKKLVHTYSDRAVDAGEDNSTNYPYMPMLSTTNFPLSSGKYNNPAVFLQDIRPGLECNNVIVGYDGYMFYRDTIADFVGDGFLHGEVYERAKKMFQSANAWAQQHGKKFYVVIAPNKNTVYPDYMPEGYSIASYRRYDQFVELINASGITAVDLRGAMAQSVQSAPKKNLYYKYDTHWNNHAGYIAYQVTMNMIKKDFPNAVFHQKSEYQINYVETYMKDQAYYLGYYSHFKDYGPVYTLKSGNTARLVNANTPPIGDASQFLFSYEATSGNDKGYSDRYRWIQYCNDYNTSAPNIYVLRDSYSIAMIPFLKDSFHLSTYNWTFSFESNKQEIIDTKSDIILAVVAERNLKNYVNQKNVTD